MKLAFVLLAVLPLVAPNVETQPADEVAAKSVLLEKAVADFNNQWESARLDVDQPRLRVEEIRAAILIDGRKLSDASWEILSEIAQTDMVPPDVQIDLWRRHHSNHHRAYVWNIELRVKQTNERLTIRKTYLSVEKIDLAAELQKQMEAE